MLEGGVGRPAALGAAVQRVRGAGSPRQTATTLCGALPSRNPSLQCRARAPRHEGARRERPAGCAAAALRASKARLARLATRALNKGGSAFAPPRESHLHLKGI